MNIFVTDSDPIIAAQNLCDQHVVSKMIAESAQMLANCFATEVLKLAPKTLTGKVRSNQCHPYHPCTLWVKQSRGNFLWLLEHAHAMLDERRYRWSDLKPHFTEEFILWCVANRNSTTHTEDAQTPFVAVISKKATCVAMEGFEALSAIDKYRSYIAVDKLFATWTTRLRPSWFDNSARLDYQI